MLHLSDKLGLQFLSGIGSLEKVLLGRAEQISDAIARMGPTYVFLKPKRMIRDM